MTDLLRMEKNALSGNISIRGENMKTATGLNSEHFRSLVEIIPFSLAFPNKRILNENALYTYLLRLRTGQTLEQIASGLNVSIAAVHTRLQNARQMLYKYFVCSNLKSSLTRKEFNYNTTELSRLVHGNGDPDQVILVLDGTYIYTEKSGNQYFQKQTYTNQKKRNFVKIMMCVTTNGKVIFASGPHDATDNDATILRNILDRNECNVFSILKPRDVILVDRGFRDCSEPLKARGLDVRSPAFLNKKSNGKLDKQLTTKQANDTRLVTLSKHGTDI